MNITRKVFINILLAPLVSKVCPGVVLKPKKYNPKDSIEWEYVEKGYFNIFTNKFDWVGINRNLRTLCQSTDYTRNRWLFRPKGEDIWITYSVCPGDNNWLKDERELDIYG